MCSDRMLPIKVHKGRYLDRDMSSVKQVLELTGCCARHPRPFSLPPIEFYLYIGVCDPPWSMSPPAADLIFIHLVFYPCRAVYASRE